MGGGSSLSSVQANTLANSTTCMLRNKSLPQKFNSFSTSFKSLTGLKKGSYQQMTYQSTQIPIH